MREIKDVVLVGGKHFGCLTLHLLLAKEFNVKRVVTQVLNDRLTVLADALKINTVVINGPRVEREHVMDADLLITAHSHAFVTQQALDQMRLGGIGYHPSLLPKFRGKDAIEQTIASNDIQVGGTIYKLSDNWDGGDVVAQMTTVRHRTDTAQTLWQRELCPIGIKLFNSVLDKIKESDIIESYPQES